MCDTGAAGLLEPAADTYADLAPTINHTAKVSATASKAVITISRNSESAGASELRRLVLLRRAAGAPMTYPTRSCRRTDWQRNVAHCRKPRCEKYAD